jgi:hypothetical protein
MECCCVRQELAWDKNKGSLNGYAAQICRGSNPLISLGNQ